MKAIGKLIFKGVSEREGGEFKNESGQSVKYDMAYILKVDESQEDGTYAEKKLKIEKGNTGLISQLKNVKPYDEIELECDVKLYNNACKIIPIRLLNSNSNNK